MVREAARELCDEIVQDNEGIETAELGSCDNEATFVSIVFGGEDFLNGFLRFLNHLVLLMKMFVLLLLKEKEFGGFIGVISEFERKGRKIF